jgi:hypothetical protein
VGNKSIKSGRSIDSRKSGKSGRSGRSGLGGAGGRHGRGDGESDDRENSPMNRWRDSPWNDRRLRKKKRKLTKKQKEKVAKMGAIYGQDARSLAGLNNPSRWKNHFGEYDVPLRSPAKRTTM